MAEYYRRAELEELSYKQMQALAKVRHSVRYCLATEAYLISLWRPTKFKPTEAEVLYDSDY